MGPPAQENSKNLNPETNHITTHKPNTQSPQLQHMFNSENLELKTLTPAAPTAIGKQAYEKNSFHYNLYLHLKAAASPSNNTQLLQPHGN